MGKKLKYAVGMNECRVPNNINELKTMADRSCGSCIKECQLNLIKNEMQIRCFPSDALRFVPRTVQRKWPENWKKSVLGTAENQRERCGVFTRIRECLISFVAHTKLAITILHMEMETCHQPETVVQWLLNSVCFTQISPNHCNNVLMLVLRRKDREGKILYFSLLN